MAARHHHRGNVRCPIAGFALTACRTDPSRVGSVPFASSDRSRQDALMTTCAVSPFEVISSTLSGHGHIFRLGGLPLMPRLIARHIGQWEVPIKQGAEHLLRLLIL